MVIEDWIEKQIAILKSYQGAYIERAIVNEMALFEHEDGTPCFEHPECPFIQAHIVYLQLKDRETVKLQTYQNDCSWGIYSTKLENKNELDRSQESSSFFRLSAFDDFPIGLIDSVSVAMNSENEIAELNLTIGGQQILLKSGEVYQEHDGGISVSSDDESVLVFLNPDDVNVVEFGKRFAR